jgi:hypothetical protein
MDMDTLEKIERFETVQRDIGTLAGDLAAWSQDRLTG